MGILEMQGLKVNNGDSVFSLPHKRKMGLIFREWLNKAGIERNVTFHGARHTHALLLLEKKIPLYTVSQLLGHKSIKTTQIYAHILDETKREAVDLLPKMNFLK